MSSDEEYFEPSPEIVVRQTGRRKANDPSPKKVPKKKQREILADFNVELDDAETGSGSSSDDEDYDSEFEGSKKRKGPPPQRGKAKAKQTGGLESTGSSRSSMSAAGSSGVGRRGSENENMPPGTSPMDGPVDDDSLQNNGDTSRARSRKRLSIRTTDSSVSGDTRRSSYGSSVSTAVESLATPSEVQNIYQTCSQMFNTNKINPQNAFNLRLLDCINQMINSPNYDKSNMQLTSSTVEIGTKIYVCRVDNTHSQVLSLASDISLQQRRKKKDDPKGEGQEGEAGQEDDFQNEHEDEEGRGRRQKQKRKAVRKRGRFVEQDNAKLLTGLEEQNVKFITRRKFLEKKFNEMTSDDLDFDYLSYFLEAEESHPLRTEQEKLNLKSRLMIADGFANAHEMSRLDFLPFFHLPKFDPDTHDIWGRSLNAAETFRDEPMGQIESQLQMNPEFAYNPADRPAEYPEEPDHDNVMNDFDDDLPAYLDRAEGDDNNLPPPVNFHDIRSLDHLDEYFQKVKSLLKQSSKSKHGWCGPTFVKPKSMWPSNTTRAKKTKVRKEPQRFDFTTTEWSDKANTYTVQNQSARTIYDDKVIESWSTQKVVIPFLGIELTSYDDEFDPLDFENENDAKYVPTIFKLFSNRNFSILDLLKIKKGRDRHQSGDIAPSLGEDMDGDIDDIEVPRDIAEDFCSQPANEFAPFGSTPAETEAGWQFPSSLPGLLNDDPLSLVSEIDSIRFSRKPKPIDMNTLKKAILKTLVDKLGLDQNGKPIHDEETSIDLAYLIFLVLRKIGEKTEKLMSVPIFIVALMHVVADKRLFVVYDDETDPDCPVVVCRGKLFDHAKHIPRPIGGFD